jgi:tRNA threonylcarbamoyladenosine biosynthesis protein TsaE
MENVISSLAALEEEVARFVGMLTPKEKGATLVTLSGELGAGKTAFTKALAHTLGVTEIVTSPTFVLEKIYTLPGERGFKTLVHIDAYRLEGSGELKALGFDEVMKDPETLVVLEWPEKVEDMKHVPDARISLFVKADGVRKIVYA